MQIDVSRWSCPQAVCRRSLISCGRTLYQASRREGVEVSSTPAPSPGFGPHRAPVHAELLRHCVHANTVLAGCSHSVHFAVSESCSRSLLWFRCRADQSIIHRALGIDRVAIPLIPRGNELLKPWSSVPTALNCFHHFRRTFRDEGCILCVADLVPHRCCDWLPPVFTRRARREQDLAHLRSARRVMVVTGRHNYTPRFLDAGITPYE